MIAGEPGFKRVGIVGLGLIGGSLALAIRHAYPGLDVVGTDGSPSEMDTALIRQAVTEVGTLEVLRGCDLLILATPVQAMPGIVGRVLPILAPGCIITDAGSTKARVCEEVEEVLSNCRGPVKPCFIGGHPMAGSEHKGMGAADRFLFENAVYILTPRGAPEEPITRLQGLLSCTGAIFLRMDPGEHDSSVAAVSHMPHIAASAIVHAVLEKGGKGSLDLAGGGFRDTTRIAMGDPDLWTGILLSNSGQVIDALRALRGNLGVWEETLSRGDSERLRELLSGAKEVRDSVPRSNRVDMPAIHDVIIALEDQPGAINRVAGILGEAGLNIVDIEILRIREGFGGTMRMGFRSPEDAGASAELLRNHGFDARTRL